MSNFVCSVDSCPVILSAICVIYQGENLIYTGINTGDNLQAALEKIDAAFADAGLGYAFQNGVVQTTPGVPVELGGSLLHDTTITGNYKLLLEGRIEAAKHITTGGTASQFVKGDGTLDSNAYQLAGNYITALTGDATATGPGSAVLTLATVNANPGTYGSGTLIPRVTVDAKGRVTSITTTAVPIPSGILVFEGDVTGSGTTGAPVTLTLATVNPNVYNSLTFLNLKVNAKGLVTGASPVTNLDIEGALGYVPVPNTRTITINGVTQNLQANRSWTIASGVASVTATAPLASTGGADPNISITKADATTDGYLDNVDWVTFNSKQEALNGTGLVRMSGTTVTYDNTAYTPQSRTLTINGVSFDLAADRTWTINSMVYPEAGIAVSTGTAWGTSIVDNSANWNTAYTERISSSSSPLSILNHVISIAQATTAADGYLSATDWNTFNNKQPAGSYVTTSRTISTTGPLQGGGDLSADRTFSITQAGASTDGYLSSTDWTTFNSKQGSGDYITALTGEATATGPGSATVTLSTPAVTGKLLTGVNITGGSVVATDTILEAFGKVQNQINGLIGGSIYKGTWNASTNTPTLTSGVGTTGWYYIVSVPGTTNIDGITDWNLGDWIIFDGTAWQQVDNTDAVVSVNGYTGAVSLVSSDVPEGLTNLYYTPARARTAISLTTTGTSGAATYDNLTGVLNVPVYSPDLSGYVPSTRTLTINGTGYDLSADRSWTVSGTMPAGGTAGQILAKINSTDYNTQWIDNFSSQVKNVVKLGAALTKGTPVYVSGADGTNMIVSASSNTTEAGSSKTFGLLETGGALNAQVECVTYGLITGLDTSAAGAAGDPVWLGPNGTLLYGLANKPVAPAHMVYIGVVTRKQQNNGEIFVNIQNGFEIEELHDVLVTAPKTDGQGLFLQTIAGTQLWRNRSIPDVLGYTPANDADVVKLTGTQSIAGNKTFTGFGIFDNTILIKQDSSVSFLAGYNSIDSDSTGIIFSLPAGNMAKFILTSLTASRDYTLPNASGTIALTSDIVPYSLPIATASVLGGIKVGSNLSINATTGVLDATYSYTLPTASTTVLGGVKVDGTTITINGSGVISGASTYSLPIATASVLGGVKIGAGVSVDAGGIISVSTNYVASRGQTNWNDSTVIGNVVGMLAWKNYGNNHVIFDASQSFSPSGSSVNSTNSAVAWTATYPTLMGWNGSTTYGVRVDTARYADSAGSVDWINISSKPALVMYYQGFTLDANTMDGNSTGFTYSNNAPYTGPIARLSETGYSLQLNAAYGGGGTGIAFRTRNGDSGTFNPWRVILNDANYTSYSPSLTGSGASGTWGINITGNAATATSAGSATTAATATNSTQLNGISSTQIFNNMGNVHGTYTDFNSVGNFGVRYLQGNTNGPSTGATQYYGFTLGLGNEYAYGTYGSQFYWNRTSTGGNPYVSVRFQENGSWGAWSKIWAGYADTAGTAANSTSLGGHDSSTYIGKFGNGNGYYQVNNWVQFNTTAGMYWPSYNGAHIYPNTSTSYGSIRIDGSRNSWRGITFDGAVTLMMNDSETGHYKDGYGWQFRWYQGTLYNSRSTYGGGTEYTVVDTGNISSYTSGNTNSISSATGGSYNWTGLNYFVSNRNTPTDSPPLQAYSNNGSGAIMSFHRGGYYAVNFGLDSDNVMRIGGWSAGVNRWQLDMSGNQTVAGNVTASVDVYSNNGWFYSNNNAGWYNNTYGQGIRAAKANVTYGSIINLGENFNGYGGYAITNNYNTIFMQNSGGDHGFFRDGGGGGWSFFYHQGYNCAGIGTDATDPSYSLHIIKYGGSNTGWIIWSDRRIKENIKTIDNALDKVLSLRGVYYNKIDDPNKERCVGYIAQEVMEVVPELVVYSEELDMYNMNYAPMVGMLTEAIKEQQAQIEELKQQVQLLLNR